MATASTQRSNGRSEATRARLIEAAVELFGTYGYDSVTTRRLAERAQVNQVAIPYHFGGKQGLYIAVAEHIVERVGGQASPVLDALRAAGPEITPDQARRMLREMLGRVGELIIGSPEAEFWARFIVREQMDPSPAFDVLYRGMFGVMLRGVIQMLAVIRGGDPEGEELRILALTLVGQLLVFRIARAAVLRSLDWDQVGAAELAKIQVVIDRNLDAMLGSAA